MILRNFQQGDQQLFIDLVNAAYWGLETLTVEHVNKLLSLPYFDPRGFFIAEEGKPVGCIGVFNLPAQELADIRYLAVKDAFSNTAVVDELIRAALNYAVSKRFITIKAVTLAVQPYVEAYRKLGFKPLRRILRIAWDPKRVAEKRQVNRRVSVTEVSETDIDEASQVFAEGVHPYWDWWVREKGGKKMLREEAADAMRQTPWFAAKLKSKIVGVTGVTPRPERGEASFSGVIVLPSFRMKGIGSALMDAALNKTKEMGCQRLVVHTMAYLDVLAPGAILYLKSGGKIEAEYLHLGKEL